MKNMIKTMMMTMTMSKYVRLLQPTTSNGRQIDRGEEGPVNEQEKKG
jgi:hypothetical protein